MCTEIRNANGRESEHHLILGSTAPRPDPAVILCAVTRKEEGLHGLIGSLVRLRPPTAVPHLCGPRHAHARDALLQVEHAVVGQRERVAARQVAVVSLYLTMPIK